MKLFTSIWTLAILKEDFYFVFCFFFSKSTLLLNWKLLVFLILRLISHPYQNHLVLLILIINGCVIYRLIFLFHATIFILFPASCDILWSCFDSTISQGTTHRLFLIKRFITSDYSQKKKELISSSSLWVLAGANIQYQHYLYARLSMPQYRHPLGFRLCTLHQPTYVSKKWLKLPHLIYFLQEEPVSALK